ncbi:MAG: S9 family peptidase [Bacteroidales bacterium]|nr:S9 family peptidase [Bacteroidales bacterium]
MKKTYLLFALLPLFAACSSKIQITEAHYERAETFLQANISKLVYHLNVQPNWLADSSGFWHVTQTRQGKRFFLTDLVLQSTTELFDHVLLAQKLAEKTGKTVDAADLPFSMIRFEGKNLVLFRFDEVTWKYNLESLELIRQDQQERSQPGLSPDGKLQAFTKDFNLFVRNLETGEEQQLSNGGKYQYEYANTYAWSDIMVGEGATRPENLFVNWSPDSRKLLTYIADLSKAQKMYLLDFSVDTLFRPRLLSYYRGSPGDTTVVYYLPVIFDLETGTETAIDVPPIPHFIGVSFVWSENADSLHALYAHRGFKKADVLKIDAATGKTNVLLSETSDTSVEYSSLILQRIGSDKVLFSSQKSGWYHLYLHDWNTGNLIKQVTNGEYVVKSVLHVDEEKEIIWFVAGGREPGRNPYYNHLYRVNFDGSGMKLLTPENAHHQVSLSPCKEFIVDNYSRVDLPTISVVRKMTGGEVVFKVSEADASDLFVTGWRPPLQFTAKARDGVTDIYGVIYQPLDFNPRMKYPLIDYSYTGPHTSITPKSFSDGIFNIINPFRAFGFAVMVVDGMGTAQRSKAFRNVSYRNMGFSLDCHVSAIQQLGGIYKWIDTTRVGIFGHSAGGYDAGRAMLQYPEIYKVGVASAADHDHRMEKAWWPEMYMGYPVGDFYHEQSNVTNAHKLQGRLLIAHGAIDENVNPSATYKLAEYLIRAQKDFDMLILPGRNHSFGRTDGDYFTKVRWNYFIRHLLGAEPVHNYRFRTILKEE